MTGNIQNCENNKDINVQQRKNIKELFEGFKGKYEPSEFDWGEPSGNEVW